MRKILPYLICAAGLAALFAGRPIAYVALVAALTSSLWVPPVFNYCSLERPLDPTFEECGAGDVVLSPKVADYFASVQAVLSARRFQSFPVYLTRAGGRLHVDQFLQVHESPSTGDVVITIATAVRLRFLEGL